MTKKANDDYCLRWYGTKLYNDNNNLEYFLLYGPVGDKGVRRPTYSDKGIRSIFDDCEIGDRTWPLFKCEIEELKRSKELLNELIKKHNDLEVRIIEVILSMNSIYTNFEDLVKDLEA